MRGAVTVLISVLLAIAVGVAVESTGLAPTYDSGRGAFTAAFTAPPQKVSLRIMGDRVDWYVSSSPSIYESVYVLRTPGTEMNSRSELALGEAFAREPAVVRVKRSLHPGPRLPNGWTGAAAFPGCSIVLAATRRVAGFVEHLDRSALPGPRGRLRCIVGGGIRTLGLEWDVNAISPSPARARAFLRSFTPRERQ